MWMLQQRFIIWWADKYLIIHKKICSLQVPVNNINLMQVIHSLGHIRCNSYHIWELKTSLSIVQEVENTPSMHEFWKSEEEEITQENLSSSTVNRRYYSVLGLCTCNYTQNRWSRACANKLDNILVTNLSVEIGLNMVGEGDITDQWEWQCKINFEKKNYEGWSVTIMSRAVSFQASRLKKRANARLCFYTIYH